MHNEEFAILYDRNNPATDNQKFCILKIKGGYYVVLATHSKKALDVKGGNKTELSNIIQYDYHSGDNQLWTMEDAGDGYYTVHAKYDNNMCWDVYQASDLNGKPLAIYPYNGGDNQKFKFERADKITYGVYPQSGNFREVVKPDWSNIKISLACSHNKTKLHSFLLNDVSADMYWVVATECQHCGQIVSYANMILPNAVPD